MATTHATWNAGRSAAHAQQLHTEFAAKGLTPELRLLRNIEAAQQIVQQTRQQEIEVRHRSRILAFLRLLVDSKAVSRFLLLTIFVNCLVIAVDASLPVDETAYAPYLDGVFLAIYSLEFLLKALVHCSAYFRSGYNRFDVIILFISWVQYILGWFDTSFGNLTFLRVFRSLRALRSFRSISSVRQLQVIVNALLRTLRKNVVDIIACLFLFTFLFAVMGFYLFNESGNEFFTSLGQAFLTLMAYVTSSGWADVQTSLTLSGYSGSEWYSVIFMFVGNFVFTNLFVGVICENIEEATEADLQNQQQVRSYAQKSKIDVLREKQKQDMGQLIARHHVNKDSNMQELLQSLAGTLRHDETIPMSHISCNVTWLETYMITQYHLENSMYRCQQAHFNIANTLMEISDRRNRDKMQTNA